MKDNYKGVLLILVLLAIMFVGSRFYNNYVDSEIVNSNHTSVGQVYKIALGAKNVSVKYKFIFNNKTFLHGLPVDDYPRQQLVGKFYKVEFSEKKPEFSRIFLDIEITDTLAIKAAGFSLEKKKKKNQFQQN